MNQPFYGEQAKPELPSDRVRASVTVLTLANAEISFAAAMSALNPASRPTALGAVTVRNGDWTKVEDAMTQGSRAAGLLSKYLSRFSEGARPETAGDAGERFSCLKDLASDHRKALVSGYLSTMEHSDLNGLLAAVSRREELERDLCGLLECRPVDIKNVMDARDEAIKAALDLKERYDAPSIDAAREREAETSTREGELLERLGRLSALAGRLDVKAMTLGEIRTLAEACGKIASRGERLLLAMREPGIENREMIETLAARRDKILNACRILDERFGTGWRLQPIDKIAKAAEIAATENDHRHPRVVEYARSFGIDAKIPQSLDGAAKTLRASQRLKDDPALTEAFPTSFRGLETDVDMLRAASDFVAELRADLGHVRGGEALISVFRSNSRRVVDEFLGYGALLSDADAVGAMPHVAVDEIYGLYRSDLAKLRARIRTVQDAAADGGPSMEALIATFRLAGELDRADREMVENRHYIASGVYHAREIAEAVSWLEALKELVGASPKGDDELASLAITAREGQALMSDLRITHSAACQKVGRDGRFEDLAVSGLSEWFASLADLRAVHEAREIVCRSEEDASRAGVSDFVSELRREEVALDSWSDRLDERYALLDRLLADDAFARDLSAAADAAVEDFPVDPIERNGKAAGSSGWVEEDIFLVASGKTEAA